MKRQRELPVNTTVGEAYRLIRCIGEGGRGVVYEARERGQGRRCALKIFGGAEAQSPEALARFQSQAETASRISHPNLIQVHDFGTAPTGEPFLMMEYLEGEDLAKRLARIGHFDPPAVTYYLKQVVSALSALHAQGLAHLGLKPTNIFLVRPPDERMPPTVKVLDATTAQADARAVTHANAVNDTLPYVAPEQATGRGGPYDERTEQWALAAIAWEMLTGSKPFVGDDPTALLYQIAYEEPRVGEGSPFVPPGLLAVLGKALAKRPQDRYLDLDELVLAFQALAGTLAPPPPPMPSAAPMMAAPNRPSGPIFLPGLTPRAPSRPRRAGGGRPARPQGVRVETAAPTPVFVPAPAPTTEPTITVVPPSVAPPPQLPVGPPPTTLRERWAALEPGRRGLLIASLPVAVGTLALLFRPRRARQSIDPERSAASLPPPPPPVAAAPVVEPLPQKPAPAPTPPAKPPRRRSRRARRAQRGKARSAVR